MRKLFLISILLLFAFQIKAQDYSANSQSTKNSSTTTLDSAATYTGTIELMRGYNSVSVSVRATQNGTLKILFGTSSSTLTLASASKVYLFSYTANDSTFARYVPVEAGYFKVIYVNGGDSLTTFRLITMLNKGDVIPRTTDGKVNVSDATVDASLNNIEADVDSIVDKSTESAASLAIMDDWDESDRAKVNPIVGQAGVAAGRGTAGVTTQRVTIANDDTTTTLQKAIKDAVEIIDNFISGARGLVTEDNSASIKTALELIDNAISGNEMQVDIVASLPAGTAIIGQFGIDQTTDGTTNKVRAFQPTHDSFNANANIQVGDADVANLNPVPVSDAGGALTVDGTVTANAGTNLNTSLLALEAGGNLATIAGKDFATQTTLALIKAKTDNIDNATSTLATTANQTNGSQKTQVVDGSGNVIGATSNALDVNVKSGTVTIGAITGNSTFGNGNLSVTTAVQLNANTACKKVTITNFTAGEYLYVGTSTVTTANGFPMAYMDVKTIYVSNLNLVYVVSDGTAVDVRFTYEN